jgi:hypothetical protein
MFGSLEYIEDQLSHAFNANVWEGYSFRALDEYELSKLQMEEKAKQWKKGTRIDVRLNRTETILNLLIVATTPDFVYLMVEEDQIGKNSAVTVRDNYMMAFSKKENLECQFPIAAFYYDLA